MNSKTLSQPAFSVLNHYLNFTVGSASCSVPYFNNKTKLSRLALRVNVGKGSPQDISDEIQSLIVKSHVAIDTLTTESLKKVLVDQNIGIDCSGFAYHVLNAESAETKGVSLRKRLSFVNCRTLFDRVRCALRPVENCDVVTFADAKNSSGVALTDVQPGDIITMLDNSAEGERDHILVIHQVDYHNSAPTKIYYSHAVAYPEDGVYGTGIKQGSIDITDATKTIIVQSWTENGKTGEANRIYLRAQKSRTELRRLR
ncbi:MAG: hypothetical protein KBC33_02945 [Candidatus Pacebacteria bacterium]|nr:hypothetical protein [Candidatus Paceibacterota bacterium]